MINSCTLCGRVRGLVSEGFRWRICLSFREDMVRRGAMPPSAHEFALEDMAAANGPECALSFVRIGSGREGGAWNGVDMCFSRLPACGRAQGEQVLAVRGRCVKRIWQRRPVVAVLRRSRAVGRRGKTVWKPWRRSSPWESLGRPRVIAACASCCKTLREALPEVSVVSLWEVLVRNASLSFREEACCGNVTLSIHDPVPPVTMGAWLRSVRASFPSGASRSRSRVCPAKRTPYCGYGGLTWDANPQPQLRLSRGSATQPANDAVTSCIICRERLVAESKPSLTPSRSCCIPVDPSCGDRKESGLSAARGACRCCETEGARRYAGKAP